MCSSLMLWDFLLVDALWSSADWQLRSCCVCRVFFSPFTLYCAVLYIAACVDASRTVLWDRSISFVWSSLALYESVKPRVIKAVNSTSISNQWQISKVVNETCANNGERIKKSWHDHLCLRLWNNRHIDFYSIILAKAQKEIHEHFTEK